MEKGKSKWKKKKLILSSIAESIEKL